ncbi:MAG: response regulator [Burkholderiales bacterium]|nr:response regulator [Flavobacterium sp.]
MLQLQTTTFFYVDDDSDDRSFFQEAADELGENVSIFELGDEMMQILKNPPPKPSVVFIDLNMPIKNGFELLQEIRSSSGFNSIPIVVYSTSNSIDTISKCMELGASLFITKAISLSSLIKAIEHVMGIDWENFKPNLQTFVYKS